MDSHQWLMLQHHACRNKGFNSQRSSFRSLALFALPNIFGYWIVRVALSFTLIDNIFIIRFLASFLRSRLLVLLPLTIERSSSS
jgi:hypothetical protein